MRAKRIWLGFGLLLAVVSLGVVAGLEHATAKSARRIANELEQRAAAARVRIATLERERQEAEQKGKALSQELLALQTSAVAAPRTAASAQRPQAFDVNQMILERPELKALYEASAKAAEMEPYGWLIVTLSPDAAERFKSERLQHDRQVAEIGKTSREQGWDREDPRRLALRRVEEERHAREMAAILDASRLEQYQEYEKTIRPRGYVAGALARELYYTEAPLTSLQARALTDVVSRHARDARGRFDFDAVNWDAVLTEARPQLEPTQFERLANLAEMRRLQTQVIVIERAFGARADGK